MGFGGSSGGGGSIGAATDVAISNTQNNELLMYDGSLAKWRNQPSSSTPIRFSSPLPSVGVTPSDKAYKVRRLTMAYLRAGTPPAGDDLVVNIQQSTNSGSTWTNIGTLTVAAQSQEEAAATLNLDQASGALLRLEIVSVGAITTAKNVVVDVLWQ